MSCPYPIMVNPLINEQALSHRGGGVAQAGMAGFQESSDEMVGLD
jgi:hypothetical protein